MNRMNRKDRVILEELDSKYGTDMLASAIISIQNSMEGDADPQTPNDIILDYIKKIEGYRIRIREIHWDAATHSLHTLADGMMSDLEEYEDSIAEDFMGIIGYRIKVGMVVPILPKATDIKPLISEIIKESIVLKNAIGRNPQYSGILNLIDDMVHKMNTAMYLADLT